MAWGLRVSACLTEDVSISVKKKVNIQKCEILLEPAWERQPPLSAGSLELQVDEGGLLPSRHSALNTFHRHTHMSLSFFPEEEKTLKSFCCIQHRTASSFHLQRSCRPRKSTKELADTCFPSHLLLHQEILPLGVLASSFHYALFISVLFLLAI